MNIFSKKQLFFKIFFSLLLLVFLVVFFKAWQNWLSLAGFILACSTGILLLFADEQFLYMFYQEKVELSINSNSHFPELATRNLLFLLTLPLLSIFVITSSGSIFGIAIVMAINSYLLAEIWQLRDEFLLFKDRFLGMAKIQASLGLTKKISYFALAYFIFLLILLLA